MPRSMKRLKYHIKAPDPESQTLRMNIDGVHCAWCRKEIPKGMICQWDGPLDDAFFICTFCSRGYRDRSAVAEQTDTEANGAD